MAYTREDSRRHDKTPKRSGRRGAAKWSWPAPPIGHLAPWGIPPQASRVLFHRLLGCISAIPQVDLIQGLTLDPPSYIRRPQPPSSHQVIKSFGDQAIQSQKP
jgi:hypothetical protein